MASETFTRFASTQMPTWFIPHGAGPCFFMDRSPPTAWDRTAGFLRGLAATLPARPRAIIVVSAHWLAPVFGVTANARTDLIYDYEGFPAHTYALRYPAPGEPALADRVTALLGRAGIGSKEDPQRGFDHGVFIPLLLIFPDADIPVIHLSLLDPVAHLDAGRALGTLREEGVLIIGSGMSFHNMRVCGDPRYGPISDDFDRWLTAAVEAEPIHRAQALAGWAEAPSARLSHPPRAEEHLLPLMVVAGAAGDDRGQRVFSDRVLETRLSAFCFG